MNFFQSISSATFLDPITGDLINELIVYCVEETGPTTITLAHDMQSAQKFTDKIETTHDGNIIWTDPAEIINTHHNDFMQQFIHGQIESSPENKG